MELKNRIYYLIKLLKLTFPVRLKVRTKAIIYDDVMYNGQEVLEETKYLGNIHWEQVYDNHLEDKRTFNFKDGDDTISKIIRDSPALGITISKQPTRLSIFLLKISNILGI